MSWPHRDGPTVYTIRAGIPFVDAVAAGILAKLGADPASLARVTMLLPTRRARRSLREAFLRLSQGRPLLLPRLQPLGDLDDDELAFADWREAAADGPAAGAFDLPPAISGLRRHLLLTRLVLAFERPDRPPDQAARLAVEFLRSDIQSAVVPRGVLAGSFVGEDGMDAFGRECDALVLHCTAGGGERAEGMGDVRKIELSCEPSEDGTGLVLVRSITENLLSPEVGEPADEVLCRGVYSFGLRYFDGAEWQDDWDSGAMDNLLPSAVEVTLELQEGVVRAGMAGGGYRTSRVFLIPCSSVTAGTEQVGRTG